MQWPLPRPTLVAVLGLIVVGVLRIVSTYRTFSQTVDEPSHMAGGLEWLDLSLIHILTLPTTERV
jgi:hypothetical protein